MKTDAGDDWGRIGELVADALEQLEDRRADFVDAACGDDPALAARVRRLIAMQDDASGFLDAPPTVAWSDAAADDVPGITLPSEPDPPELIAGYRLRGMIATGGAGTVYEAEQERPHRTVALKLLRRDVSSAELLRRFELEAEILAHLQHPSIAHVYAAGVHRQGLWGQPYIAMELVRGGRSIVEYASAERLGVSARLGLFLDACDAIEHGHGRGIVHRDLKPSNILVDADGRVKVIDFGVARVLPGTTEQSYNETRAGDVIGTLPYMSPEQCGTDPDAVGPAADVYGLGVVLFELLAGRVPLLMGGLAIDEAIRTIREEPPARLRRLAPALSPDLDAITATALAKDPRTRYATVRALGDDVRRHLALRPIVARPPGLVRQARLFARRNRGPVAAAAIVLLALAGGTVTSSIFAVRADQNARTAASERDTAEAVVNRLQALLAAPDPHEDGADVTVLELLDQMVADLDDGTDDPPEVEARVRRVIGGTYLNLDRTAAAATQLALAADRFAGIDEVARAGALNFLGVARRRLDQPEEAEAAFRACVSLIEHLPVGSLPNADVYYSNLATQLSINGRLAEALPMAERVLAERLRRDGPDDLTVCVSQRHLATIHRQLGDWDAAERFQRDAAATAERSVPEGHPILAAAIGELGMLLDDEGRPEDAVEHHLRAWELTAAHRTPGSRDWQVRLREAVASLRRVGRTDEARATLEAAIAPLVERAGEDDPRVAELRGWAGDAGDAGPPA